jgi:tRNA-dihydrouridine synthase
MKIGNLEPESRFFLAPMAEVNDIAFRILCKRAGAGLTYTGMVNPLTRQKLALDDKPAVQLFCVSAEGVADFIRKHDKKAALFDLNLGCPSWVAKRCGFGAFMHNKPEVVEGILKEMRGATDKPVTVKLRKSARALELLKLAEKHCDAVAIHPRTEEQGYSGEPDLAFASRLRKKTRLPVIYSGNVTASNAKVLLKEFDFLMVGRAAMGHPEIFAELKALDDGVTSRGRNGRNQSPRGDTPVVSKDLDFAAYLKLAEKHGIRFEHIKAQALRFVSGMEGAKEARMRISKAKTLDEVKSTFGSIH